MTTKPENSVSQNRHLAEVIAVYLQAMDEGRSPDREELLGLHPELAAELTEFFADQDQFDRLMSPFRGRVPSTEVLVGARCGDYELIEEIARGGMGVVFKARNVRLDRIVALKMILAGHLATPAEVDRFRSEARSAAQFDHPNIVPIYEVGEDEGRHYFAMKLIEGVSLAEGLPGFADAPKAAAELMKVIARAVHYAHQRGILHRDLKPANILIDRSGQPHVTDFGLAKRLAGEGRLPSSSAIVGTPSYMAPEQASGNKVLSTAVDVYSLGAILYELLTGRSPFRADTPFDTLIQVVQKEPVRPRALNPRVDRDLETICLKCLSKQPERRYGSAEAMAEDLDRWLTGEPIRARRAGTLERLVKWARRRKSAAATVVVSLLAIVALVVTLGVMNVEITRQKEKTDQALEKYKNALHDEQRALSDAQQTSYYQTIALAAPEVLANHVRRADQLLDSCPKELRQWEWGALERLCHAESRSLSFPAEPAAVVLSPDGHRVAAAGGALGEPGFVAIWDADSGREVRSFRGHDDAITGLAFNPAGDRLATASRDRTVRLWDPASGRQVLILRGHSSGVSCVAFSPDGRLVASAGEDCIVKIWDVASGSDRRTLAGHAEGVWCLAFSPDGRRLASGGGDQAVRLWDVPGGVALRTIAGHAGIVHGVAFSPDGRLVASAGYDGTARVWNAANGRELVVFRGHSRFVTGVVFSPDGRYVASGSVDRTVKVWESGSGEAVLTLGGHRGAIWGVAFSRNGWRIASTSDDRSVKLWEVPALEMIAALRADPEPVRKVAPSGDGRRLAVLRGESTLEVWDTLTARRIFSHPAGTRFRDQFALSPRGDFIAAEDQEVSGKVVRVWSVDHDKKTWSLARPGTRISGLSFSADGRRLAITEPPQGVLIWEVASGKQVASRQDRKASASDEAPAGSLVQFNPDGTQIVMGGSDPHDPAGQALTLFDAANGENHLTIRGGTGPLDFSADGRRLVAADPGADSGDARVFDVADGREVARLRGHTAEIRALAFTPDGARIASSSRDGTVKVWDASSGRELLTLPENDRPPEHLRFGAAGARLIAADDEGALRIWETGSVKESVLLRGFQPLPPAGQ